MSARPIGDQLGAFFAVAFELAKRGAVAAALSQVLLTITGTVLVTCVGYSLALPLGMIFSRTNLSLPEVVEAIGFVIAIAVYFAAVGLVAAFALVGPLTAYALAAQQKSVSAGDAVGSGMKRVPGLTIVLTTSVTFLIVPLLVQTFFTDVDRRPRLPVSAFLISFAVVALAFVHSGMVLVGGIGLGERVAVALRRARELGRGARLLQLAALLASAVPIVAASAGAFPAFRLAHGPREMIQGLATFVGCAASINLFALLAVAARIVAADEDAKLLEGDAT